MWTRKALTLPGHLVHTALAQAVVVQPGLANAHHARQCGAAHQVFERGLLHAFVVGVHTHGGPEVVVAGGEVMHLWELFQRGADAQGTVHASLTHLGAKGVERVGVLREVQVAVRIDKHGARGKNGSANP
jgi:hypothetical protein